MKNVVSVCFVVFLLQVCLVGYAVAGGRVASNCTKNGKSLHGNVKVVKYGADFKVKVVGALGDLDVQEVTALPSSCGQWKYVDSGAQFTVQFVDSFEDFSIRRVTNLPGIR